MQPQNASRPRCARVVRQVRRAHEGDIPRHSSLHVHPYVVARTSTDPSGRDRAFILAGTRPCLVHRGAERVSPEVVQRQVQHERQLREATWLRQGLLLRRVPGMWPGQGLQGRLLVQRVPVRAAPGVRGPLRLREGQDLRAREVHMGRPGAIREHDDLLIEFRARWRRNRSRGSAEPWPQRSPMTSPPYDDPAPRVV